MFLLFVTIDTATPMCYGRNLFNLQREAKTEMFSFKQTKYTQKVWRWRVFYSYMHLCSAANLSKGSRFFFLVIFYTREYNTKRIYKMEIFSFVFLFHPTQWRNVEKLIYSHSFWRHTYWELVLAFLPTTGTASIFPIFLVRKGVFLIIKCTRYIFSLLLFYQHLPGRYSALDLVLNS